MNQYWNQGFATEALVGICKIAFEKIKLHRIEAHVNLDNIASKKVLINGHFFYEGIRQRFILEDDVWTDNEIYSMTLD